MCVCVFSVTPFTQNKRVLGYLLILVNMARDPTSLELMGILEQPWIRHQ